jgi:hypothetical protein
LPAVSVIIPVRDEPSLHRAVASVCAQTFGDWELIVVDDGSTNNVGAILSSVPVDGRTKLISSERNQGPGAARNIGIRAAAADYIAFLDADDIWHAEKLGCQLAWMTSGKQRPSVTCTWFRLFTPFRPEGQSRQGKTFIRFDDVLWGCTWSPGSTMMAHRQIFEKVGLFEESLRRLEDWDWLLRATRVEPVAMVPRVLAEVVVGPREEYPLEDVLQAADTLKAQLEEGRYGIEGRSRRLFLSSLYGEVSAAAFLRRHYGAATGAFVKAFAYRPFKRASHYRRIMSAVASDITGRRRPVPKVPGRETKTP